MPFDVGSVVAHIKADLTGFKEGMAEAKNAVGGVGDSVGKVSAGLESFGKQAAIFTGVVGAGLVLFGKQSITSWDESARIMKQTEAVLKSTGGAAGVTTDAITKLSEALQNTTPISDETARATQNMLLTFTSVGKDVFPSATKAIIDTAFAMNHGLTPTTEQLVDMTKQMGKALQDPEAGLGALHRVGVNVEELKVKFETVTDTIGRQKLIVEELSKEFGGSAAAQAETYAGKLEMLKNKFDDVKERIGSVIEGFVQFMVTGTATSDFLKGLGIDENSPIIKGLTELRNAFIGIGEWIAANQALVITFLEGLAIGITALLIVGTITTLIIAMTNPLFLVVVAITALYTAFQTNFLGIRDIFNAFVPYLQATWQIIIGIFQLAWAIITGIFNTAIAILKGDWSGAWDAMKNAASLGWSGIVNIFNGAIDFIKGWGGSMIGELVRPFQDAWNTISRIVQQIKDALDFTKRHSPSVLDIVQNGVALVNDALSEIMVTPTIGAPQIAAGIGAGASSVSNLQLVINMDGAIIADEFSANSVAEKLGNQIIRKLRTQVRF